MSVRYGFAADEKVLEFFASLRPREREQVLQAFGKLADDPFQLGDFVHRQPGIRDYEVKQFGRWEVSWWADHAVHEVRIVQLARRK